MKSPDEMALETPSHNQPEAAFTLKSPIVLAREAQNLSRTEAAIRMGVNYFSLARLENGLVASLSEKWRPRFALMGWPFDHLKEEFAVWHRARMGRPAAPNDGQ
jgi:hypothetical protein